MKLSLRLETIYKMVPYSVTADVGSDHGKLMISLFQDGRIPHGYAIENKKGPFTRLTKAIKENGLLDDVVPLFSDGITDLPECVTTIVLAGMGGENIINIISSHVEKLKNVQTIIVDAHNSTPKVRKYITELGYVIADEKMVKEDDIYYEIIKFIKADTAFYSDNDIEFGPILRNEKSATFKEKYQGRIDEIDRILANKNLPNTRVNVLNVERERLLNIIQ